MTWCIDMHTATRTNTGRFLGQLMPLDDARYPWVVMRKTCQPHSPQYLGRLPASEAEINEYRQIAGFDPADIYVLSQPEIGETN